MVTTLATGSNVSANVGLAMPALRSELTEGFRLSGAKLPIPTELLAGWRQFAPDPSLGAHESLPTKQQRPPSLIKFLQERLDHSWDVHAIGQAFALTCVTRESPGGGV